MHLLFTYRLLHSASVSFPAFLCIRVSSLPFILPFHFIHFLPFLLFAFIHFVPVRYKFPVHYHFFTFVPLRPSAFSWAWRPGRPLCIQWRLGCTALFCAFLSGCRLFLQSLHSPATTCVDGLECHWVPACLPGGISGVGIGLHFSAFVFSGLFWWR